MRDYAVYDTKDNDLLIKIGNVNELAEYFETSKEVIYSNVSKKTLSKSRYQIVRVEYENE